MSNETMSPPVIRGALAALVVGGLPALACAAAGTHAARLAAGMTVGRTPATDVVLLGVTAALAVALAWLTAGLAAGAARAVGALVQARPAVTPGGVVPALACALVLAVAAPASAAGPTPAPAAVSTAWPGEAPGPAAEAGADASAGVPGWVPRVSPVPPAATGLVASAAAPDRSSGSPREPPDDRSHVVVRGDSLWSIAAARLGPGATAAEISAEWPRWWRANHGVVGDDPDVLHPGQVLRPPPGRCRVSVTTVLSPPPLRVLPAPDCEPAVLCAPPGPRAPTGPHHQLHLVVGGDAARGVRAASAGGRADPEAFARAVCQGVVDVLAGQRPAQQMMRWLRPDVFDGLRRRAARAPARPPSRPGRRPVVRSVRTCRISPDAVEAAAVILDGGRARAMALRLEGVGRRWRVTALVIG